MSESNNAVKTILSLGEEKMGEVVNQLLANEGFVIAVQKAITGGIQAKRSMDKGLSSVLSIVNIPTVDDVDKVRSRLQELEEAMGEIHDRLQHLDARLSEAPTNKR